MEQVRGEIRDHFFQPYLTAMLTRLAEEAQQPTLGQAYLARDEALAQFVSVIERFTDDFIDPAINRIFAILWRRGMLPPPPDSLQGKPLEQLLAEIVVAGGVIPMLIREGYIEEEPTDATSE